MKDIKDVFQSIIDAQIAVSSMKPTYCGEIDSKMRKGVSDFIETIESYYTAYGTQSIIKDKRDGQEYVVTITPKKVK
jgi:hypothetical protein